MSDLHPETIVLIEDLLAKYDIADVRGYLRQREGILVSHADTYAVYVAIAATKLGRKRVADFRPPLDPPESFTAAAATQFNPDLAATYGTSVATVSRWRRETGVVNKTPIRGGKGREVVPADFAERFAGRSVRSVQAELGLSSLKTTRWFREAGLPIAPRHGTVPAAPKANRTNAFKVTSVSRPVRDSSRAGMAADYLRRLSPVWRCDTNGGPNPKGGHWRRGSAVLTDADLIERAMRNGWQPDAWKAVRPTTVIEGARA